MRAIRVHVQNRRREAGGGARSRDRAEDFEKPLGVGQPYVPVGTDIKQCRSRGRASACRDEHRKPMAGQAQVIEDHVPFVRAVRQCHRRALEQMGHLAELGDSWIDARKNVALVVDNDEQRQRVQLGDRWQAYRRDGARPDP